MNIHKPLNLNSFISLKWANDEKNQSGLIIHDLDIEFLVSDANIIQKKFIEKNCALPGSIVFMVKMTELASWISKFLISTAVFSKVI